MADLYSTVPIIFAGLTIVGGVFKVFYDRTAQISKEATAQSEANTRYIDQKTEDVRKTMHDSSNATTQAFAAIASTYIRRDDYNIRQQEIRDQLRDMSTKWDGELRNINGKLDRALYRGPRQPDNDSA